MSELLIVQNPGARRGAAIAERVAELLTAAGREFATADLGRLGEVEPPSDRVLAVGGDGTVNAVVSWLHSRGARCPVGIVPAGTGNNLYGGLGLAASPEAALQLALEGRGRRRLDLGVVEVAGESGPERRLFLQSAALGFPAEIAARYEELRRGWVFRTLARPLGMRIYQLLALAGLRRQKQRDARGEPGLGLAVEFAEGTRLEGEIVALFLGNERSLGGDFIPCPRAEPDDGLLDVCSVPSRPAIPYLRLFGQVRKGEHLGIEGVEYHQTAQPFDIILSRPTPFLADGDLWRASDRFRVEIVAGGYEVVVDGGGAPDVKKTK